MSWTLHCDGGCGASEHMRQPRTPASWLYQWGRDDVGPEHFCANCKAAMFGAPKPQRAQVEPPKRKRETGGLFE